MDFKVLFVFLMCIFLVACTPMKFGGEEEEVEEEAPPAYEINPHFGFRKYYEVRYEPLTVPYMEYQPYQTFY